MRKREADGLVSVSVVVGLVLCAVLGPGVSQVRAGEDTTIIVIRGTDSLSPVIERWVTSYSEVTPEIDFDIEAEGTDRSIEDLLAGRADIAAVLRPLSAEERTTSREKNLAVRETVVARTGIAIVTHASNPVASMSVEHLAGVFAGEIQNWMELGGPDEDIVVVRKESGWSPSFFQARIMAGKQYLSGGLVVDSKQAILDEVSRRPWTIGITGMPEVMPVLDRVNLLRLERGSSEGGSTYALSRPAFFCTAGDTAEVQAFVEYVNSTKGQQAIVDTGYFPAQQGDGLED